MQEINLYHLLKYYAKNWAMILSFVILGLIAGLVYNNAIQEPLYRSEATLTLVNNGQARTSLDSVMINNYVELFKSRRVLEPVIREQGYDGSYRQLLDQTTAVNEKNTEVIKVSISAGDAQTSKALVEGAVESFRESAENLYGAENIEILDDASLPREPYNVKSVIQLAIATIGGLLLALLVLFFVYDYNNSKSVQVGQKKKQDSKTKLKPIKKSVSNKLAHTVDKLLIGAESKTVNDTNDSKRKRYTAD